jgi:hypothetical protein
VVVGVSRGSEPAYPAAVNRASGFGDYYTEHTPGMTLREHYAGLAMQGLLAKYGSFKPSEAWGAADVLIAAQEPPSVTITPEETK